MRYWATKINDIIKSIESYSHDYDVADKVEITESEFKAFMNSLPQPPPPTDWKAEWLAADTVAKKIAVIARRLDLA